jgi:glyoxylase-like metal-dependent hydrolase (beta-lactamase superfamily II)
LQAAVLLAGIHASLPGAAQFPPPELAIHEVREGVYQILSAASGGITVLTSDDGVLLVDTKFDNEYTEYMELLRTVTDQPIRYVINTHMHGDHTGGNIRLEGIGANIIATDNARRGMAATQQMGLPVLTFDDHMRIYFGGQALDLYWLGRGHTDGDLVVHLPEQRMVLTGDLFAGFDPSLRLVDYNGGGSFKEWSATLEKVLELDFDTVIPGHREVTVRAKLEESLAEVIAIQNLIREMHANGRSPEDIQAAITSEYSRFAFIVLPGIQAVIAELE